MPNNKENTSDYLNLAHAIIESKLPKEIKIEPIMKQETILLIESIFNEFKKEEKELFDLSRKSCISYVEFITQLNNEIKNYSLQVFSVIRDELDDNESA